MSAPTAEPDGADSGAEGRVGDGQPDASLATDGAAGGAAAGGSSAGSGGGSGSGSSDAGKADPDAGGKDAGAKDAGAKDAGGKDAGAGMDDCSADGCTSCVYDSRAKTEADCHCPLCPTHPMSTGQCSAYTKAFNDVCSGWLAAAFCPLPACVAPPQLECVSDQCVQKGPSPAP